MTLRLNLFFVAMDVLILIAYPIVFIHSKIYRFLKSQTSIAVPIKMVTVTSSV